MLKQFLYLIGILSLYSCNNPSSKQDVSIKSQTIHVDSLSPANIKIDSTETDTITESPTPKKPSFIEYGAAWEDIWWGKYPRSGVSGVSQMYLGLRGIILTIKDKKITDNLPESVEYEIHTDSIYEDGYLVSAPKLYNLNDYFLDYISAWHLAENLKRLQNKASTSYKFPKHTQLFIRLEKQNGEKQLTFTIKTGDKKIKSTFIEFQTRGALIEGSYLDSKNNKAIFNKDGSCQWLNYRSFKLALYSMREEKIALHLSKFPIDTPSSKYWTDGMTDVFIFEHSHQKDIKLFEIIQSDSSATTFYELVHVFGYPLTALRGTTKGNLVHELSK